MNGFRFVHSSERTPTLFRQLPRRRRIRKDTRIRYIYIYIYNYKLTYTHTHTRRRLCPYARSDPRSTVQRFVVKSIFGRGEELYSSVYHAMSVAFTNVTFPILFHLTQEIIRGIHNKYLFINIFFN